MSLPTNLTKPNTLIAGTDALAADVNGDLDYILAAQNASNTQTNTNTDEIVAGRGGTANLNTRFGNVESRTTDLESVKAPIASPALTGVPTAPTAAVDTNTTQLATTAFAKKEADDAQAFAIQRANHTGTQAQSTVDNLVTDLAAKAPLASPTFTGVVTIPAGASIVGYAPLASPALTGTPTVPTATAGTSTTQAASTAFVQAAAFNTALPAQTGNAGKFVTTDGTNASWGYVPAQSDSSRTYTGAKYTRDDDGTVSGGTWAIDYANGPVIKATAGANITSITMSNWPVSGTAGHLRCMLVNFGAYTITFPTAWKWIKSDLTTTTTFGDLGLTLPSSGTAIVDLFGDDGGTTIYAKVVR